MMSHSCSCHHRRRRVVLEPEKRKRKFVHLRRGQSVLIKCCHHAHHTKTCVLERGEAVKVHCGHSKAVVTCGHPDRCRKVHRLCLKPGEAVLLRCKHC
jgi:hypothetical protein